MEDISGGAKELAGQAWPPSRTQELVNFNKTRDLLGVDCGYIENLPADWLFTAARRRDLISWMWKSAEFEGMVPQSFFSAAHVFDAYLSSRARQPQSFRLLAVAALSIGAKLQETRDGIEANLLDMAHIEGATQDDKNRLEAEVLVTLGYDVQDEDPLNCLKVLSGAGAAVLAGAEAPAPPQAELLGQRFALSRGQYLLARFLLQSSCLYYSLLGHGRYLLVGASAFLALRPAAAADETALAEMLGKILGESAADVLQAAADLYACVTAGEERAVNWTSAPPLVDPELVEYYAEVKMPAFGGTTLYPPCSPRGACRFQRGNPRPAAELVECPQIEERSILGEGTFGTVAKIVVEGRAYADKAYKSSPALPRAKNAHGPAPPHRATPPKLEQLDDRPRFGPTSYDAIRELSIMAMLDSPRVIRIAKMLWMPDGAVSPVTPYYPSTLLFLTDPAARERSRAVRERLRARRARLQADKTKGHERATAQAEAAEAAALAEDAGVEAVLADEKATLIPPEETKRYLCQLLEALECLHSRGVAHRDIKPDNIYIDEDRNLVLGDFGTCRRLDYPPRPFTPQMGTLWYRPPEVLIGGAWDLKSDIWSAGCVAAEMITGWAAFNEATEIKMIDRIFNRLGFDPASWPDFANICQRKARVAKPKKPRSLVGKCSALPEVLEALDAALTLNPKARPSASELLAILGRAGQK